MCFFVILIVHCTLRVFFLASQEMVTTGNEKKNLTLCFFYTFFFLHLRQHSAMLKHEEAPAATLKESSGSLFLQLSPGNSVSRRHLF